LYQGNYPDALGSPADCQVKYWESADDLGSLKMNKSYRYFDGSTQVTDSFTGLAELQEDEGAASWLLTLSQGGERTNRES